MTATDTLYTAFPGISLAAIRREVAREGEQRARVYPGRVTKNQMPQKEADYQLAIFAAILSDVAVMIAGAYPPPPSRFTWDQKRAALARELDYRTRLYPGWIAKNQLAQDQADHQIACLAALKRHYDMGWGWKPSTDTQNRAAYYAELRTVFIPIGEQHRREDEAAGQPWINAAGEPEWLDPPEMQKEMIL